MLKRWGMSDSEHCICGEKDLIEHSLVECPLLEELWLSVSKNITLLLNGRVIPLSTINKLFGYNNTERKELNISKNDFITINNILIIAKFAINKCRASSTTNYKTCFETEYSFRKSVIHPKKEDLEFGEREV